VIINKFTDDPSDAIWEMIFAALGAKFKLFFYSWALGQNYKFLKSFKCSLTKSGFSQKCGGKLMVDKS